MGPALRGAAVIQGGWSRPPLQGRTGAVRNGTAGTPSPTHSVIARSEATRQSVLPSPKRRIPTPVTRSLARNDSAAALTGRRGRRPLQNDRGTGQDAVPYTRFNIPSCRAGPVCPAAGYAFFGGTHGSRPTGCDVFTGRAESSAPTGGTPQPYTCTQKKSCPRAALFDLVMSGVRLRSSPAPS